MRRLPVDVGLGRGIVESYLGFLLFSRCSLDGPMYTILLFSIVLSRDPCDRLLYAAINYGFSFDKSGP